MKALIEKIIVTERVRKEITKIDELSEDIKLNGLLHPIIVMALNGGEFRLLAGLRRLKAVEKLGEIEIEVKTVSPANAEAELRIEISENEQREPFTFSEKMDFARLIEEIEKTKALERKSLGGKGGIKEDTPHGAYLEKGETREKVAEKIGMGKTSYGRAKYITQNAPNEVIEELDKGQRSIRRTYEELRAKEKAKEPLSPSTSEIIETDNKQESDCQKDGISEDEVNPQPNEHMSLDGKDGIKEDTDDLPYLQQDDNRKTEDNVDKPGNGKHPTSDACDKPRAKEKGKKISKPAETETVEKAETAQEPDSDCQKNNDSRNEVNSQQNQILLQQHEAPPQSKELPKNNAPPSGLLSKADEEAIARNKAFNALPPQQKVVELQRQLKEERARAAHAESELERLKELRHNDIFHKDGIINNLRERLEEAESRVKELEDLYGVGKKK